MVRINALGRRSTWRTGSLFYDVSRSHASLARAARTIGDSEIFERTTMLTMSSTKDSRNGTRQPQPIKASAGKTAANVPRTKVPSAAPVGAPAFVNDAAQP